MKTLFRQRKWMCMLLACMVMLSGMYFDQIKADSFFAYAQQTKDVTSTHITEKSFSQSDNLNAEELRGARDASANLSEAQRVLEKCGTRIVPVLLSLAVLPEIFTYQCKRAGRLICCNTISQNVIIHYIHQKDGQKEKIV